MAKKPSQKSNTVNNTEGYKTAVNSALLNKPVQSASDQPVDKKSEILRMIIAISLLVVITLVMTYILAMPLFSGITIFLKTLPVDPMDPLRGQYMDIRYEIGDWDPELLGNYPSGSTVYVELYQTADGTYARGTISAKKPSSGIFIKGLIVNDWRSSIQFGIEQYFFEKDAVFPTENITVEVKVDSNGNARIVQLLQYGKPVKINYTQNMLLV